MTLGPSTYAVRVFSGFASHWDFVEHEAKLKRDLLNDGVKLSDDPINGVVYAGYDRCVFVYVCGRSIYLDRSSSIQHQSLLVL